MQSISLTIDACLYDQLLAIPRDKMKIKELLILDNVITT